MFVYMMQAVVQPRLSNRTVERLYIRYSRLSNCLSNRLNSRLNNRGCIVQTNSQPVIQRLFNRFDNWLYRVNGLLESTAI